MNTSKTVVKLVAIFEAIKATLVLLAGFGVLSLVHRNLRLIAAAVIGRLHLDPTRRFAGSFIEAAAHVTDARLWLFAGVGFLYALFHFVEAYGLWFGRAWAEWLAVVSGGLLLPFEVYELVEKFTWVRVGTFTLNVIIVVAMALVLAKNQKLRRLGVKPA